MTVALQMCVHYFKIIEKEVLAIDLGGLKQFGFGDV